MAACGIAPEDDDGNASVKTPALSTSAVKALVADIAACANEDELKAAYFEAIKVAGNDQAAKTAIIKAKDEKKGTL